MHIESRVWETCYIILRPTAKAWGKNGKIQGGGTHLWTHPKNFPSVFPVDFFKGSTGKPSMKYLFSFRISKILFEGRFCTFKEDFCTYTAWKNQRTFSIFPMEKLGNFGKS